jgi:hypothetical protein
MNAGSCTTGPDSFGQQLVFLAQQRARLDPANDGNQFSLAVTSNPGVPRGRRATTDLSGRRDGLRTSGRIIGSLATRQGLTSPVGVSHGACFATQIAH